jgi:uncharacterized protein HemX
MTAFFPLCQAQQALHAADQLWGPAGVIIATLILAMVSYLVYQNRSVRKGRNESQSARLDAAQAYADRIEEEKERRIQAEKEHANEIRELERDMLETLRDVTELLGKLERSDQRMADAIESVESNLTSKIDDLHTTLRDH